MSCRLQGPPAEEEVNLLVVKDVPPLCLRGTQGRSAPACQAHFGESWEQKLCPFVSRQRVVGPRRPPTASGDTPRAPPAMKPKGVFPLLCVCVFKAAEQKYMKWMKSELVNV